MATTQGEIRIGSGNQARLPDYRPGVPPEQLSPDPEFSRTREELRWIPAMTLDTDLLMYLRAARSMAAFAGMCDGGCPEDGANAASRDDTTINALDVLHDSGYDPGRALQALVKCPVPKGIDKKWSEEETKRFVKGLRQFGKNFFRIRKDLLPHRDTPELVEFYYLWKKTPGANNNRPHRRRRPGSLRRIRNTRNSRGGNAPPTTGRTPVETENSRPSPQPGKEPGETSSVTEDDNSEDDSDSRDAQYRCSHCFTTNSRDWQTAGKDRQLYCWDCRVHLKKTNELPPLTSGAAPPSANGAKESTPKESVKDNTNNKEKQDAAGNKEKDSKDNGNKEPSYLFRPVADSPDASPQRMRTRNKAAKEQNTNRSRPKRGTETPEPKTPSKQQVQQGSTPAGGSPLEKSSANTTPNTPGKKKGKNDTKSETPSKSRKRGQDKADDTETDEKDLGLFKKKRERAESPSASDSGSINDEGDTNEPESESTDGNSLPPSSTPAPIITSCTTTTTTNSSLAVQDSPPIKPAKIEPVEIPIDKPAVVTSSTLVAATVPVPVITTNKVPTIVAAEPPPQPLNVSIRLPDDINERKNLIKRNLAVTSDIKELKFPEAVKDDINERKNLIKRNLAVTSDIKELKFPEAVKYPTEIKSEPVIPETIMKIEKEIKDEIKDVVQPDKFKTELKTELIIPKVPLEKVIIKEELESSNEAINLNPKEEFKDNLFLPQTMNIKEQINFSLKDTHLNHLQPLGMSEMERPKEQIPNPQPYLTKDTFKNEYNVYNQKEQNAPLNAVVKLEPRDEPMELTSSNRADLFNQSMTAQTLNIPTVIPMSQSMQNRNENMYEEEKREKLERPERVERPDRGDLKRPDRGDLTIGQPPLPNIMQSANLVTIGGQSGINHYGYMSYNPHSPRNLEKNVPTSQPLMPTQINQMEPQNLKIKQEVPETPVHNLSTNYAPYSQGNMSSSSSGSLHNSTPSPQINPNPPQINVPSAPSSGYGSQSNSSMSMMNNDPLQSLKDVKVPGFSLPSVVAQSVSNERPSSGSAIEIKKEPEYPTPITSASPIQPPVKSPAPKTTSSTPTPTINVSQTPPLRQNTTNSPQSGMSYSAINLISPGSNQPPSLPPTSQPQHPFGAPMHPPHPLMQSIYASMHQFPHSYPGYPYSFSYPYGPMPQPHAIPPPHQPTTTRQDVVAKPTIETSTTMISSHSNSTTSSLTARREVRETDEHGREREQTHETTLTQHHSTSHHSAVHSSTEKQGYGGANHSITISHSTSSSTSQSLQHKINQKIVRTNSPHNPVSQSSASLNHSASASSHQHTHHHTHHHERMSPGNPVLSIRHGMHPKPPQTNPHHLMIQPPSMGHHGPPLGPPSMANSSLEALRAHATT
ncbi:Atrophin-1 family [Popillia japonica]|uniref:Atrophin-1 family n=1 Tax=Popillia japonica TaxID=7064 RepID=A0AAW1MHK6_POPJA